MFDYANLINARYPGFLEESADWLDYRYCYAGGRIFRDQYLEKFTERESQPEFERRKRMTPTPTFAKRAINKIRNALSQRFSDILRRGGSKEYQLAVSGEGFGIDQKGSSLNAFLVRKILPDLLVMGRIGVFIDAPELKGATLADTQGFRPYIYSYPIEQIPLMCESGNGSRSDFDSVMLVDKVSEQDKQTGIYKEVLQHRHVYIDPATGKVNVQFLETSGQEIRLVKTDLTEVPFVLFDIGESLIKDICPHQIALLNMISSDTAYSLDANFPFLTKQSGSDNAGEHLKGNEGKAEIGLKKGMKYPKGMERPNFVSPPTEPLMASIELRREIKTEIDELVHIALEGLSDDGTIDGGLAFIGMVLEAGENRIADHFAAYMNADPAKREHPTIKYPEQWSLKTNKERTEEANELAGTMYKVPGRKVKKEIAKLVADALLRGRVTIEVLDEVHKEIDDAPYCTSDPDIIIPAKKEGLMSTETGTLALGGDEKEAERAKKDAAERAAMIVQAQADTLGARGAPDLAQDPNSAALEKEGASKPADKLGGEGDQGVRGKDSPVPNYD